MVYNEFLISEKNSCIEGLNIFQWRLDNIFFSNWINHKWEVILIQSNLIIYFRFNLSKSLYQMRFNMHNKNTPYTTTNNPSWIFTDRSLIFSWEFFFFWKHDARSHSFYCYFIICRPKGANNFCVVNKFLMQQSHACLSPFKIFSFAWFSYTNGTQHCVQYNNVRGAWTEHRTTRFDFFLPPACFNSYDLCVHAFLCNTYRRWIMRKVGRTISFRSALCLYSKYISILCPSMFSYFQLNWNAIQNTSSEKFSLQRFICFGN